MYQPPDAVLDYQHTMQLNQEAYLGVEIEQEARCARNDLLHQIPMAGRHTKQTVQTFLFGRAIASENDSSRWSRLARCCPSHDSLRPFPTTVEEGMTKGCKAAGKSINLYSTCSIKDSNRV